MPNIIAYIALFSWPLVVFILFRTRPSAVALIWSLLAGLLLLPSSFEVSFPVIRDLDKTSVPNLSVAAVCFALGLWGRSIGSRVPGTPSFAKAGRNWEIPETRSNSLVLRILIFLLFASPILTVLLNRDAIFVGGRYIPGLRPYDALSMSVGLFVEFLPFFLARRFLASPESHVLLLRCLCVAGLVYSVPMLFEARMSPQLHTWIYGYFPHQFSQHIRGDGFRPVVFFRHGLLLGVFVAMTILAVIALWRSEHRVASNAWLAALAWMIFMLLVARSLGPLVLVMMLGPIIFFMHIRTQLLFAAIVGMLVLSYPALRSAGLIPVTSVYDFAYSIDPKRAQSFKFRTDNEDLLLARANERPVAGWGSWGRPEIHDPETGETTSTWDGAWIITFSNFGWLGYIAQFGLLTYPIFALFWRRKQIHVTVATSGLAIILTLNLIDLIPNASLTPMLYLISGALVGRCFYVEKTSFEPEESSDDLTPSSPPKFKRRPRPAKPAGL